MFILTADQVTPRQAIRRKNAQVERLLVILYRQWLFIKGESYPSEEKEIAIQLTRKKLDAGQMCILVVDSQNNYVVCYEDKEIELLEEKSADSVKDLQAVVEAIRTAPNLIKNNRHKLRAYPRSLLGNEMVTYLSNHLNCSREEAVKVGQSLIDQGWLHHTWDKHDFKDEPFLYRFYQDERFPIPFLEK
mgnify:CR=1 FL=1